MLDFLKITSSGTLADGSPSLATIFRLRSEANKSNSVAFKSGTKSFGETVVNRLHVTDIETANARVWGAVSRQFQQFNEDAAAQGETCITDPALRAAENWVRGLNTTDHTFRIAATGMFNGGSVIILTSPKTERQFTLRFTPDGKFLAATGVRTSLEGSLLPERESTPEGAVHWLTS